MKITKYPQSNFLIESESTRILVDPGYLTFEKYTADDFGKINAIDIPHCQLLYCQKCGRQLPANELIPKIKKCKIHPESDLDKVDGPPNTGFLINGILFHPGDGI